MNKALELELVQKYPKILRDYGGDRKKTCMHWGMECGDGWFKLLDSTMNRIQYMCDLSKHYQVVALQIKEKFGSLRFYFNIETVTPTKKQQETTTGHAVGEPAKINPEIGPIVQPNVERIPLQELNLFSDIIELIVAQAENQSSTVCEVTGAKGKLHKSELGWLRTLSDEEAKSKGYTTARESYSELTPCRHRDS